MSGLPPLWISLAMLAPIGALAYRFNVSLPLFVTVSLRGTEIVFTLLYSVFSFGALISALAVAHRNLVAVRHVIIGSVALGITLLLLASAPGVSTAVPLVFLVGMASILYMTATTAIVQVEAKPEMHGRVLALQTVLMGGTSLVGGPFLGWLADMLGGRAPLIVGGIVCLAAAAFGHSANQRKGRL